MALITASFSDLTTGDTTSDDGEYKNGGGTTSDDDPNLGGEYQKGVKYLVDNSQKMQILPSQYVLSLPKNPLTAVSRASIPTIDLSGLDGAIENRRSSIIQLMSTACSEWGFFRIINHDLDISLMEKMLEAVKEFFDLSLEEKVIYASSDVMNPVRYGTSLNTSKQHALHWRDYLRHYGHPISSTFHLWPNKPPAYRNVAKEYLEKVWVLALSIAGLISEGLGLEQDHIEKSLGEGSQIVASNYYPPCPEPDRTLGLSAHSDHGGLTILMQNNVDGLQVKHNQTWVAVPNVPGSFVVNIGDYLEILSNGRYKSVEHRAVVNSQETRISVAVGHGPELMATIRPASPLVDETDEIKYRPITYKDYMRCQQSSAVRGKTPLQAIMTNNAKETAPPIPPSQI